MAKHPSTPAGIIAGLAERKTPWSYAAIGRALGVDSSYVSQVARGAKKPNAETTAVFKELARTRKAPPAPSETTPRFERPRRKTVEGTPAKVRGKAVTPLPEGNRLFETKRGFKTLMSNLQRAAKQGKGASLTITFATLQGYGKRTDLKNAEVNLFTHAGWDAARVVARLEALGYAENPENALRELTYQVVPGIEGAGRITGMVLQTWSRK